MMLEISKLQLPQSGNSSVLIGVAHHLAAWTNNDKTLEFKQFLQGYRTFLQRKLNCEKVGLIFCNSAYQANHLALTTCYKKRKKRCASKLLVFSHSFTTNDFEVIRSAPQVLTDIFAVLVDPILGIKSDFFKPYIKLGIPILFDQTEVGFNDSNETFPTIITLSPHPKLGIVVTNTKNSYKRLSKVKVASILSGYYQSIAIDQGLVDRTLDFDTLIKSTKLLLEIKAKKIKNSLAKERSYLNRLQEIFLKDETSDYELKYLDRVNFETYKKEITKLEEISYEKARQTPIHEFEVTVKSDSSISYLLFYKNELVGMIFASRIKNYPLEKGLKADPFFNDPKTLYVVDCTVSAKLKGKNLGKLLKYSVTAVAQLRGFKRIEGRIRDQLAKNMLSINLSLGSYCYRYYKDFYSDNEKYRDVLFYTTLIRW